MLVENEKIIYKPGDAIVCTKDIFARQMHKPNYMELVRIYSACCRVGKLSIIVDMEHLYKKTFLIKLLHNNKIYSFKCGSKILRNRFKKISDDTKENDK